MRQSDDESPQQIITREIVRDVYANGRSFDRIVQALIPVAIIALVAAVWVQSIKNERLAVIVEHQTKQIDKMENAVTQLAIEVRELRDAT